MVAFSESDASVFGILHIAVIFSFQNSPLWCFHAVGVAYLGFAKLAICIADTCPLRKCKGSLQSLLDAEGGAHNWVGNKSNQKTTTFFTRASTVSIIWWFFNHSKHM